MLSPNSQQALEILRDPSTLSWYVVPMIAIVLYAIYFEIDRNNWRRVFAAFAFVGMDLFNELWNGLVMFLSDFAPVWGVTGPSAFRILVGWNIEIVFAFMLTGIMATMALPADKHAKIWGLNNRVFFIIFNSMLCVGFEMLIHQAGIIVWEWPWWNASNPWLIFLVGYVPFFTVCYWVYDMDCTKKQGKTVASIYGFNGLAIIGLASMGWI